MASPGTVVVFVLTFNRPRGLPRAVASVLAQTYRDLICAVVDDGSRPRPDLSQFDDPRLVLVSGPQRPPEDKNRLCTSSWVLNRAQGLLRGARWCSYLTDLGEFFPDRLEKMTAAWDGAQVRCNGRLGFLWGHQVHEGRPDPGPGERVVVKGPVELRAELEHRNFVDLASVLEDAYAAQDVAWDETPEAWPDPDRRRWLRHAWAGRWAVRVPVASDLKRTSALNAGRALAAGASPADLARGPRE